MNVDKVLKIKSKKSIVFSRTNLPDSQPLEKKRESLPISPNQKIYHQPIQGIIIMSMIMNQKIRQISNQSGVITRQELSISLQNILLRFPEGTNLREGILKLQNQVRER